MRRIAIEPLESRRLLAVTGSLSGYAYLDTHDFGVKDADEAGFAGLTVQLQSVNSQGNLSNVAGVGPVQTLANGSYSFTGLAAGTYQIQILPSSELDVGTLSPGSAGGTVGSDEIQVTLAAGQSATDYNFAILGAQASPGTFMAADATATPAAASLPTVTTDPISQPVVAGSTATFTAAATGSPTPTVQWQSNTGIGTAFTAISGATSTTYSFTTTSTEDGDQYEAVFTNSAGSATTTAATLTVQTVPTVTTNPASKTVLAGNTVAFTAAANGSPTPTVQWESNTGSGTAFTAISGATSISYSFTTTSAENG
ncbi:MAG: immunoglobulin domain-containing protein, partial [Thermoguttaceae bacterium]